MVSVVEELKGRLAELEARLAEIKAEAIALEAHAAAFATVIKVFDPSATSELPQQPKRNDRSIPCRRVTDLLRGRDVRRGALELLQDAEEPILAGELSKQFAHREDLGAEIGGIGPNLAGRFSARSNGWSRQGFGPQTLPTDGGVSGRLPGSSGVK